MTIDIREYSNLELALMVMLGHFGTGIKRKQMLGDRYKEVQPLVNMIASGIMPSGTRDITLEEVKNALYDLKPTTEEYDDYVNYILSYIKEDAHK